MEWYKNYQKGKPFYTISSRWTLQKNYYAGWITIEHHDGSQKDHILTMSGSQMARDMTGMGSNIEPFPEEDLPIVIGKIKESREAALLARIKRSEEALEKAHADFADRDDWEPKLVDFKDVEDYNYDDPCHGRFDSEMYKEVHVA
ncbi:hypothetical protein VPHD148_0127 [Vibrio phage D148]